MSDQLPPIRFLTSIPKDPADTRDINMNRLPPNQLPPSPPSPWPATLTDSDGRIYIRQPDGSYAPGPTPPWLVPAAATAATAGSSHVAAISFVAVILILLAAIPLVAVGLNMTSGPYDTGEAPPAYAAGQSTIPGLATPVATTYSGAARANQIVTDILKGCRFAGGAKLGDWGLVFEAVPGADLDTIMLIGPDPLFDPARVAPSDLYTVTVTVSGSRNHGARGRWAVDISTGGVVPLTPLTNEDGAPALYHVLQGVGCSRTTEMG